MMLDPSLRVGVSISFLKGERLSGDFAAPSDWRGTIVFNNTAGPAYQIYANVKQRCCSWASTRKEFSSMPLTEMYRDWVRLAHSNVIR